MLLNFVDAHSLKIIKHGATHHTRTATTTSDTHIDVILIDANDKLLNCDKFPAPYAKNGHDIITATVELFMVEPAKTSFMYRDYKGISPEALMTALAECSWSPFDSNGFELHTAFKYLNDNLINVLDNFAPLKTVKPVKGFDPWMDDALISLRRRRNAVLRRYLRTRLDKHCVKYTQLRDEYNMRFEESRNNFMQTKIADAVENNSNGVWQELRNLGLLPQQREELHGITPDDLNSHFASVSTTNTRVREECFDVISKASENGFRFSPVDFNDVVLAVAHFSTQARGSDAISLSTIAKALPFVAPYIVQIINASLTSGIFPEPWKESLLIALKKTATPSAPTDFRPIALLCFLSKVQEKIVYDQIHGYLLDKKILNPRQAGYRQHSSTQIALLRLTEDARQNID